MTSAFTFQGHRTGIFGLASSNLSELFRTRIVPATTKVCVANMQVQLLALLFSCIPSNWNP